MLFNCEHFEKAFKKENCPFTPVCNEGLCPFVCHEYKQLYEDLEVEYDNQTDLLAQTEKELEDSNNDYQILENTKDDLEYLNKKLIRYIIDNYNNNFTIEDLI